MKKDTFLIVILLLALSKLTFGETNSQVSGFSEYINSPQGTIESPPVNKNIAAANATGDKKKEHPDDRTDAEPRLQGIPARWKVCAKDSDCTSAVADCVSWEPLNKKYLSKLRKDVRSCSESIDPGFQPQAACVDQACQTTSKTTDVSWEEWLGEMSKVKEAAPGAKDTSP